MMTFITIACCLCMPRAMLLASAFVAFTPSLDCMHPCRLMHQSRQDMGSTGMAAQCSTTKQALW